jgi:hypothetical protein
MPPGCTITLSSTLTLTQNVTIHGEGATISGGNAVRVLLVNSGVSLTLDNLTIANANTSGSGGGIANAGTLTITNTTFSNNGAPDGGAIYQEAGAVNVLAVLTVTNSTFSGNSASGGGAIFTNGINATLTNTIVANSTGGNCAGTITDKGGNLADDNTCGVTQVTSAALNLGSLANNGGPTQTFALGAGSTAIDHSTCLQITDQRGLLRPDPLDAGVTTNCDSGAYESRTQPTRRRQPQLTPQR